MTIKLNIGNYQSVDFTTNEYSNIKLCYKDIILFLIDWVDYTENARLLIDHIKKILERGLR